MSIIGQARRRSTPAASITQIVAATVVSTVALFTAQMAALTAWVETYGAPGGLGAERVEALGRPFTGRSQAWHAYGPLLWGVYALGLVVGTFLMWRTILGRPSRPSWWYVPALLACASIFWHSSLDRFSL